MQNYFALKAEIWKHCCEFLLATESTIPVLSVADGEDSVHCTARSMRGKAVVRISFSKEKATGLAALK